MENLAEIFFPYEKIKMAEEIPAQRDEVFVITEINGDTLTVDATVYDRQLAKSLSVSPDADRQNALSVLFYGVMSSLLEIEYPWGILYGVRPARFFHSLTDKFSLDGARDIFSKKYLVSPSKIALVEAVAESENKIIALSEKNSFSLYVSIPFCPTRCSYCSFVSHSIEQAAKLIDEYVELLVKEIAVTGEYARQNGLRLETVYFGGGTPTTLSAAQLSTLFDAIEKNFDLSNLREYTVEAGRPDTVTRDKLLALKSAGVGRISINPQSFNDSVLQAIGRRHTVQQTLDAFSLARECGFDNINMDFIAGLPEDDLDSFKNSLQTAVNLGAENITVHTLSLKTGAYMATRENAFERTDKILAADMVDYAREMLTASGYKPYYMYRQGKSLGNLENVGWCKQGRDCLYNVFMMDETHTVLAVGAGAVIKLKHPKTGKIERIYNYKYPYEYIRDFDNILNRKEKINIFLNS
jgi:oxygen-independent coproporphyrinogen-3 oxidase